MGVNLPAAISSRRKLRSSSSRAWDQLNGGTCKCDTYRRHWWAHEQVLIKGWMILNILGLQYSDVKTQKPMFRDYVQVDSFRYLSRSKTNTLESKQTSAIINRNPISGMRKGKEGFLLLLWEFESPKWLYIYIYIYIAIVYIYINI